MINVGKCTKCETILRSVNIEDVEMNVEMTPTWKGISYVCPMCQTILGVQIDPVALKTEIIEDLVRILRK